MENLYEALGYIEAAVGGEKCRINEFVKCGDCPFGAVTCKLRVIKNLIRERIATDYKNRKEDD